MKLPDAMHTGKERSVRRGRGFAANAAPVSYTAGDGSAQPLIFCKQWYVAKSMEPRVSKMNLK